MKLSLPLSWVSLFRLLLIKVKITRNDPMEIEKIILIQLQRVISHNLGMVWLYEQDSENKIWIKIRYSDE